MTGPVSVVYDIPPIPEGEYYFHCDVHPNMSGTVVGRPAKAGAVAVAGRRWRQAAARNRPTTAAVAPEGTAAASVAAEGTAFDPTTLTGRRTSRGRRSRSTTGTRSTSRARTTSRSTTAIPRCSRASSSTGRATVDYTIPPMEAGTYEFRCDVHPTMIGTVEVT